MIDHFPSDSDSQGRIDHSVDTEPLDYASARMKEAGFTDPATEATPFQKPLPGKPLEFPKSGYVRDFHEPRAVRGEFKATPQTEAANRTFHNALNQSHAETDFQWLVALQEDYLQDRVDIHAAKARLATRFGADVLDIATELFGEGLYKSSIVRLADRDPEDF